MTLFFEVLLQPVLAVLPIIESPVRVVSELISGIYKVCGKDVGGEGNTNSVLLKKPL